MRRLTVSLITILAFATVSLSAFAANRNDVDSRGVLLNPTLVGGEGSGIFPVNQGSDAHYGLAPSWGDREGRAVEVRMDNPSLQGVFENVE